MAKKDENIVCPVCSAVITNPVINPQNSSLGGWVTCQNCQASFHQINLGSEIFRQAVKERYLDDLKKRIQAGQDARRILKIINKSLTAP